MSLGIIEFGAGANDSMVFDEILMEVSVGERPTMCRQQQIGSLKKGCSGRNQRKLYRPVGKG